jgi:cystathionine beta-lyase/cystathionine gamma-synthase
MPAVTTFDEQSTTASGTRRSTDVDTERLSRAEDLLTFPRWPQHGEAERRELLGVLEPPGWWRMAGSQVDLFEAELAAHHGAPYAVAVNSGTAALTLLSPPATLDRMAATVARLVADFR